MGVGDVCVVGSANLDLVAHAPRHPLAGETLLGSGFAEHPGGKGLNQAVAAARAGARTSFVGAVGDDGAGDLLRRALAAEHVDVKLLKTVEAATGRALIVVDDNADNSIVVVPGANAFITVPRSLHCDVLLVQLEIPLDIVSAVLAGARRRGTTTILNPAPAAPLDDELLGACDYVVPNEHELDSLGGSSRLFALGVRAVIVTEGADGVEVIAAESTNHVDAFAVRPVDTTAAGDAFCGYLAAALAAGDELTAAVRRGAAAGALATTRAGAVPSIPDAAAVDRLISAQ